MKANYSDVAAGLIFSAMGLFVSVEAYRTLGIGSALNMGPGYFPMVLGLALTLVGVLIIVSSLGQIPKAFGKVPWRGVFFIGLAPIAFALTVGGLGMGPAIAVTAAVSIAASPNVRFTTAIAVVAGLVAFALVVFSVLLDLPIPILGPWMSF